jgi:Clp amino terminal domain, pathogenicity island component
MMFERYTEKARRAIFFARYEASHYGSPVIDTEHLLLGLVREDKALGRSLSKASSETIRQRIDDHSPPQPSTSTSVDLPLSGASKRILKYAADEADRLSHRQIGTEHLLLGILDERGCFGDQLLREAGTDPDSLRLRLAELAREQGPFHSASVRSRVSGYASGGFLEIHGVRRNTERIRDAVERCRIYNWHWDKRSWTDGDIVIAKKTGKVSFDLNLASDSANFELVKGGWKKGHCFICRFELFESQNDPDDHGTGYTNGHDWLCTECWAKFWERPDFFSSSYSDIT